MLHETIRSKYPEVTIIIGDTQEDIVCYNDNGEELVIEWDNIVSLDEENEQLITSQAEALAEYTWAQGELAEADIQINKILDGDEGSNPPIEDWRAYRCSLRAYVNLNKETGLYSTEGNRPTNPLGIG